MSHSLFDTFSFRAVMPGSALKSFGKWQTRKQAKARRGKVYGDIKKDHQEKKLRNSSKSESNHGSKRYFCAGFSLSLSM